MGRKKSKFNYTPLDFDHPRLGSVLIRQPVYYQGEKYVAIQGVIVKAECVEVLPMDTKVHYDEQLKGWVVEE